MLAKLMDAMFGCWHSHYSFPITIRAGSRRGPAASVTGTYVTCLDCGKELPYDWSEMKVLDSQPKTAARALVTKPAA
jgi:hypothetical protein